MWMRGLCFCVYMLVFLCVYACVFVCMFVFVYEEEGWGKGSYRVEGAAEAGIPTEHTGVKTPGVQHGVVCYTGRTPGRRGSSRGSGRSSGSSKYRRMSTPAEGLLTNTRGGDIGNAPKPTHTHIHTHIHTHTHTNTHTIQRFVRAVLRIKSGHPSSLGDTCGEENAL